MFIRQITKEQWQMLLDTSRLLNSQLEMDKLLEMVLEKAMVVACAEAGTLWLVEEDSCLVPVVVKGPKAESLKGLRLRPGEGLAGKVVGNNQPLLVRDAQKDPAWAGRFDSATGFKTNSLLCIPLRARTEVIGCLQLVNKRGEKCFNSEDMEIALAFAGQAAIALENSRLYTWQGMLLNSLIRVLASALDARDPYTRGHSERVSRYSVLIGREAGFSLEELEALERVALLHDVGKIGIRDDILLNEGPLESEKWQVMKLHPEIGAQILEGVKPDHLAGKIYEGALYHQEKYDGSGYPKGLRGEEIPLVARIIAVADTFDAITTDRPYHKGACFPEAVAEIKRCSGTYFDPHVVEWFLRAMEKKKDVRT
jgi:HD-GYP domain-containing protein (c-di-GMP phosphodiesterase class II)